MCPLTHLILLSGLAPTVEDQRLLAFASAMGISTKSLSVQEDSAPIQSLLDEFQPGTYCLAIHAETLALVNNPAVSGADFAEFINQYSAALLVFGFGKHLIWPPSPIFRSTKAKMSRSP